MQKTEWEMYCDEGYYHMWAVRDKSDTSFNSPRLFHFMGKEDAEAFKTLVEKAY